MRAALLLLAPVLALAAVGARPARAGGYDTPMLYSARHMGMGGTAVGYVKDPSALFHNPSGLGGVGRFSAIADFSLLLGGLRGSPDSNSTSPTDIDSELTVAPMFLLGAAYRITDWMVAGLGVYPIASAGATYEYDGIAGRTEDETRLVFIEGSPGVAFNLPGRVRLGVGYRLTYVGLKRFRGNEAEGRRGFDFELSGINALGLRGGAQWTVIDGLELGVVYRHKVTTTVKNDEAFALGEVFRDAETDFVLPSKLGVGGRFDVGAFGVAVDGEYLFNSQNEGYPLVGTRTSTPDMRTAVPNFFRWQNEFTVRTGVEYRLLPDLAAAQTGPAGDEVGKGRLALRLGYVFDGKTTNPDFPSAFGTPPAATHIVTAGAGWDAGRWEVNLAYGRRAGSGRVNAPPAECIFCGAAGNEPYALTINGIYLDVSFALD